MPPSASRLANYVVGLPARSGLVSLPETLQLRRRLSPRREVDATHGITYDTTMPRVVLDTNVVVAGLRSSAGASHELLRRLRRGELEAVLTVPLLLEYEEVLTRESAALGLAASDVAVIVDALAALTSHVATGPSSRPRVADPSDEHVVDAALAAGGAIIVTHNVRHLRGLESLGLRVLTPKQLLEEVNP